MGERKGGKILSSSSFLLNKKLLNVNVKVSPDKGWREAIIGAVFKKSVCSRNEGGATGLTC